WVSTFRNISRNQSRSRPKYRFCSQENGAYFTIAPANGQHISKFVFMGKQGSSFMEKRNLIYRKIMEFRILIFDGFPIQTDVQYLKLTNVLFIFRKKQSQFRCLKRKGNFGLNHCIFG